ncbi:BamA/OMP85 family outer membrane protein [Thermus filiformis]|uniref:Outer membrane protein/protective antigen OMA87 n=1 Tax=Thermus filiformis TaxID=276 RepID=A0A0A2WR28_THEFI|nr:POTRA domain-containing protein [Thermus filiformis]KGQ22616.1 outer membrane protein/protective antigen OMA87 [Thermus filiformis]
MKRLIALLVLGFALAAPVKEIVVEGADPVLEALARVSLPFAEGDEVTDLEPARKALLETGFFKDVRLSFQDGVLRVVLVPNPPIREVRVQTQAFPEAQLKAFLEQNFALGPGATYNPKRAQEAASALAQAYRQAGFPFVPRVTFAAKEGPDGVELTFQVEEGVEVKEVRVEGVSLLPKEEVERAFQDLKGTFSFAKYQAAVQKVAQLYGEKGYRGSGVDLEATLLKEGVLQVQVRELKVGRLEGEGLDLGDFPLKPGEFFNYEKLLEGVQALSRKLSRQVAFDLEVVGDKVNVRLSPGPEGGLIREVRLEGNTAFPNETLLPLLRLKEGEVYTPALAQEDFARILDFYRKAGYELLPEPRPSYQDGVYTQVLQEVRIQGYRLEWQGEHRTQDEVILRELPKPGSLLSVPGLRRALTNLMATGLLAEPPQVLTEAGSSPEKVVLVLRLKEARTGLFTPSLGWSSLEGWSGSASFKETNLFGLGHRISADLAFIQNDAKDNLSFSLSYEIPWLYLELADLKEVRTSLSFSLYSTPVGNIKLLDGTTDTGWEYTERRSGLGFSLARPLSKELPNLRTSLALSARRTVPELEVYDPKAPCDPSVTDSSNERYCDGTGYKNPGYVKSLLEAPGWTVRLDTTLSYLDVDSLRFRTRGYEASLATGLGLSLPDTGGRSFFVPVVVTGKTYFPLEERQALALRLSAGALLGSPPQSERFYLSGSGAEAFTLRGYEDRKYGGLSFATSSLEYRYDFNLSPQGGTNLYGVLFTDLGLADNTGGVKWSLGLGFQLDLDVFGALLPSLRLDYAFSPENPTGKLHFRIGPMF